jgi:hypothetical protein
MRRRTVLQAAVAGAGAALAGCSAAANEEEETTNDVILVNRLDAPTEFEVEAVGPTTRELTYEVEANTARRITDYIDEGTYRIRVANRIEVEDDDGGTEFVTRTDEGRWNVEDCHTCKLRARRTDVEIEMNDCQT